MPPTPIPPEVHREIGASPTHATHADQWGEHGYVLVAGVVYEYAIDRKEGHDELIGRWPTEAFRERSLSALVRAWIDASAR